MTGISMMKKTVAALLFVAVTVHYTASAEKLSVGINEVEVTPALKKNVTGEKRNAMYRVIQAMGNQLIDRLHNTRKFKVVARGDLEKILKEQDVQKALSSNPVQAFKIAGCKYTVVTTVDNFQDIEENLEGAGGQVIASKRRIRLSSVAKIYNTETAELKESANFQLSNKKGKEHQFGVSGSGKESDKLLLAMARTMADSIANRVVNVVYPAKVISKPGDFVIINRGDGTDIAEGQKWQVLHTGEKIVDPDTGEVLGKSETPIGKVEIVDVTPKFSRAKILEDYGIEKLNTLRRIDEKKKQE